jgi:hypothetical protein
LDLPEGQDAAVLLEQNGFFSWHLPVDRDPAPNRVIHFELDVQPVAFAQPPEAPRIGSSPHMAFGPFGDVVVGGIKASVLTFTSVSASGVLISLLERSVHPGLVLMTGNDVESWKTVDNLRKVPLLPADRPAKILLFVHGTFSSTVGAFGMLSSTPEGRKFLEAADRSYDAVIGFDHRTLSRDPLQNATDLQTRLMAKQLAFPPTLTSSPTAVAVSWRAA